MAPVTIAPGAFHQNPLSSEYERMFGNFESLTVTPNGYGELRLLIITEHPNSVWIGTTMLRQSFRSGGFDYFTADGLEKRHNPCGIATSMPMNWQTQFRINSRDFDDFLSLEQFLKAALGEGCDDIKCFWKCKLE